jgi:phosphoribosylformylglycinamidine cyclo-ligase
MAQVTYKDAGVDLELYEQAMGMLPRLMKRTHTPRVIDMPGGFAGLFQLKPPKGRGYKDPILVSGTDGVGTKIKVAIMAGVYNTVGIDLVAMSVNDCLCTGAEPLFFLDYVALGKDDPHLISQLVEGVAEGCKQANAALIGGETAIMPDLYAAGDFDLAGFCVGVVERKRLVDGSAIRPKDVVIGVQSSGCHSNGYSLVRKIVFDIAGKQIDDHVPELNRTVGEALLAPTLIYSRPVSDILQHPKHKKAVRGIAHITGGGIADNLERILPENSRIKIDKKSWPVPEIFSWLQTLGGVETAEMFRVFNMGLGLILVVKPQHADRIQAQLAEHHLQNWVIGAVHKGERGVELHD